MITVWSNKHTIFQLHEDWRVILAAFATVIGAIAGITELKLTAIPAFLSVSAILYAAYILSKKWALDLQPFIIVLGFCILSYFSGLSHIQQLPESSIRSDQFVKLLGQITNIEDRVERPLRITIKVEEASSMSWLEGHTARLNVRTKVPDNLVVDCKVAFDAVLTPPTGPIVPYGYDFGYQAYISGIIAQGFAAGAIELTDRACQRNVTIDALRQQMSDSVRAIMDNQVSGVAAALITGDRSGIDTKTRTILRDAGLSHLLAISGLHMGLVTGSAFFILELLLVALISGSNRIPARKLAALGAALAAIAYLLVSGAGIATTRAFIMVCIGLLAVMTDRRVISLRSLSFAAIALVLISPQIVISISFQMSFAATAALVMIYERVSNKRPSDRLGAKNSPPLPKFLQYFIGVAASSLVAQLAIAPLALYHFQSISVLGATANILAIPIMAFIVMPSALLGSILMPFGADFVFWPMEQGLRIILAIADYTGQLPASSFSVPPIQDAFLVVVLLGFFIASIFREKIWLAVSFFATLVAMLLLFQKPADVLLAGTRPTVGYIGKGGAFTYNGTSRSTFRANAWRQYWGINGDRDITRPRRTCVAKTCITEIDLQSGISKRLIATENISILRQACASGQLVVSTYRYRRFCRGAVLFLSKEDLARFGPVGIWYTEDARVSTVKWSKNNPYQQRRE